MTKDNSPSWGYGSYTDFVREFEGRTWTLNPIFTESLYTADLQSKFHASIIRFDGKGMVIRDPFSYFAVRTYIKKKIKESKRTEDWS